MSRQSMVLGLAAGAFAAAVAALAIGSAEYHRHGWYTLLLIAMGAWGALSVSQLWARHDRYERILLEHGLLRKG